MVLQEDLHIFEYSLDLQYLVKQNAIKEERETEITGKRCISFISLISQCIMIYPSIFLFKNINKMFGIINYIK